ncbi:collagen binding domain-containing protein [Streptomyces erythrochromogenes]|uniref:MSCRAMM family protein n=1 Tax=Streptomyces erythrochromogenes TaxID=285574 RepID=UPI001ADEC8A3|nr:prealbumin-like fold domain-containing protein [Streptomyces erythrochromogenes]MCX5584389.1 prealbumin-like fold domain-containing protein [Streptomyces erythrochromogenes]
MTARTMRAWPIGLTAAVVLAAAAPARAAPPEAPPGTARAVLRSTDADTGTPLSGARFELWREANDRAGLQSSGQDADERHDAVCVTDAKGVCSVELPTGETYYAVQVEVPAGYDRPDEPFAGFDLGEGAAREGIIVNVPGRRRDAAYGGGIRVRKRDGKTGAPLHGAVFQIWKETNGTTGLQTAGVDADHRARPGCATDADGTCDFEGLADGAYFLVEKDVPEGYVLPKNPVAGPWRLDGASGRRLVVTVYNKRAEQIPTVGGNDGRRARTVRAGAPLE